MENPPQMDIFRVSLNGAGSGGNDASYAALRQLLKTSFTSLHNVAHRANAKHVLTPPAGLA